MVVVVGGMEEEMEERMVVEMVEMEGGEVAGDGWNPVAQAQESWGCKCS